METFLSNVNDPAFYKMAILLLAMLMLSVVLVFIKDLSVTEFEKNFTFHVAAKSGVRNEEEKKNDKDFLQNILRETKPGVKETIVMCIVSMVTCCIISLLAQKFVCPENKPACLLLTIVFGLMFGTCEIELKTPYNPLLDVFDKMLNYFYNIKYNTTIARAEQLDHSNQSEPESQSDKSESPEWKPVLELYKDLHFINSITSLIFVLSLAILGSAAASIVIFI